MPGKQIGGHWRYGGSYGPDAGQRAVSDWRSTSDRAVKVNATAVIQSNRISGGGVAAVLVQGKATAITSNPLAQVVEFQGTLAVVAANLLKADEEEASFPSSNTLVAVDNLVTLEIRQPPVPFELHSSAHGMSMNSTPKNLRQTRIDTRSLVDIGVACGVCTGYCG